MCKKSLLLLFLLPFQFVFAQTSLLTDFPEGYTPKEVGKRLAYHFIIENDMLIRSINTNNTTPVAISTSRCKSAA